MAMVRVLLLAHSDLKPTMGYVYEAMGIAKKVNPKKIDKKEARYEKSNKSLMHGRNCNCTSLYMQLVTILTQSKNIIHFKYIFSPYSICIVYFVNIQCYMFVFLFRFR